MIVHVASFSPSTLADAATGGFEWRHQLSLTKQVLSEWLATEQGEHNLALVHLEVPDGLDHDGITAYIDAHLEAVEPAGRVRAEAD